MATSDSLKDHVKVAEENIVVCIRTFNKFK